MIIEQAYCEELGTFVTPYEARDAYFQEANTHKKFHFFCLCGLELFGANIYQWLPIRQRPNFRKKPNYNHNPDYCGIISNISTPPDEAMGTNLPRRFKESPFPTEFILTNKPVVSTFTGRMKISISELDALERQRILQEAYRNRQSEGPTRTSVFQFIVDSYESANAAERLKYRLTIRGVTKSYEDFFKEVGQFQEESNLIYHGVLNTQKCRFIKEKGYRLVFEDKAPLKGCLLQITLFIPSGILDQYHNKKLFLLNMEKLFDKENVDKATCYFVGVTPRQKDITIKRKNGGTDAFPVFDAMIQNLNHLVIKFNDMGPKYPTRSSRTSRMSR